MDGEPAASRHDKHAAGSLDAAPFVYPVTDFYRTDPISRASATMDACSEQYWATIEGDKRTGTHG